VHAPDNITVVILPVMPTLADKEYPLDTKAYLGKVKETPRVALGVMPACILLAQCDEDLGVVLGKEIKAEGQDIVLRFTHYIKIRNRSGEMEVYPFDYIKVRNNDLWRIIIPGKSFGIRWPSVKPYIFSLITHEEYAIIRRHIEERDKGKCFSFIAHKFEREEGFDFSGDILIRP